ncbi:MAG: hypothetical protein LBI28_05620 [Treponema sp.]|jgi:hypothetical protein|nr:hypothetical protein [Treponema sp.]
MNEKNKEFLESLGDDYKDLPPKMRVRVNATASRLLELQKENNAFLDNAEDLVLEDERGD